MLHYLGWVLVLFGHAALWIAVFNRAHALDMPCRLVKISEQLLFSMLGLGTVIWAWLALPAGVTPQLAGLDIARRIFLDHGEVSRDLTALRAVQSLSVLDVRNYRHLVFRLGRYQEEGEDPELATALP